MKVCLACDCISWLLCHHQPLHQWHKCGSRADPRFIPDRHRLHYISIDACIGKAHRHLLDWVVNLVFRQNRPRMLTQPSIGIHLARLLPMMFVWNCYAISCFYLQHIIYDWWSFFEDFSKLKWFTLLPHCPHLAVWPSNVRTSPMFVWSDQWTCLEDVLRHLEICRY